METSQKEPFDQIFRPPRGREGHKKWFEIVHWVVMNVFEPFNSYIMMYLKLGLTLMRYVVSQNHNVISGQNAGVVAFFSP